jgi:ADP-heptose:LPS heptosyltransferase
MVPTMIYHPTHLTFMSLKAFGDLVIANSCLQRIEPKEKHKISQVIGSHLVELSKALGHSWEVEALITRASGVPAIFDVRKEGVSKAIASAFDLRSALKAADLEPGTSMVFDNVKRRERFLAAGRPILSLPENADNIYQAYLLFFEQHGIAFDPEIQSSISGGSGIGIFPGSRIADKNLSHKLIVELLHISNRYRDGTTLYLLEEERPDLEGIGIPYKIVSRSFRAMCDAIKGCNIVIGADSMPAHIAETYCKPVFVLSPVPNRYWLPLSSFKNDYWALFGDKSYASQLENFIASQVTIPNRHG